MIRILFCLAEVQQLAQHAVAATEHKQSFSEALDETAPIPALWLVCDDGLYLASNGWPHLPNPANPQASLVAYAHGYRTLTTEQALDLHSDGECFVEVLPLLEQQPGQKNLHAQITDGVAAGAAHFAVEMDAKTLTYYVATADLQERQ